jgi:type VI secretion system secreted protein VgrG
MINALTEQLSAALAAFSGTTRLYELTLGEADSDLLVEAFAAEDAVDEVGARDVIVLSSHAYVDPASLLGQPASFALSLADGRPHQLRPLPHPHLSLAVAPGPGAR